MLHYPNTETLKQARVHKKQEEQSTGKKHIIVKDRQWINNGLCSIPCYTLVLDGTVIRRKHSTNMELPCLTASLMQTTSSLTV
jgi:hypothetical protein